MNQTQHYSYDPTADLLNHTHSFSELESNRLDESLDALDMLGRCAPILNLDAPDAATLLAEPECTPLEKKCKRAAPASNRDNHSATSHKMPPHKHSRKASKKQVHELQAMVDEMQVQVNGAATEIQQLALFVGQFALQREQEQEQFKRHKAEQQEQDEEEQLFRQREMDMDISTQQQHLQAQIKQEHEQYLHEQRLCQIQMHQHQRLESLPLALKQGAFLC